VRVSARNHSNVALAPMNPHPPLSSDLADVRKQGNCVSKASVSYSPTMSRWDPEPTSFQRWMVRHSTRVRLGATLFMLLGMCWMVYGLLTRGVVGLANGSISAVAFSGLIMVISVDVSRRVEKHDAKQRPNSG
jgi:hypothetical protein